MSSNRVLVFGESSRSFLAIVRSLGRRGIEVHAAPRVASAPALYSSYLKEVHHLPPYDGSRRWINGLRGLIEKHDFDLLVPSCERSVRVLDAHRGDLEGVRLALPSPPNMQRLFDKFETREIAKKLDVPVASGRLLTALDTTESLINEYGLPLVIKTRWTWLLDNLADRGYAVIVRSAQKLAEILDGIDQSGDFIVEEFFIGTGVGVSVLASKGRIGCAFQHLRIYEPLAGGGSSVRKSEALDPELLDACRKICQETEFHGVAMLEFRVDRATGEWLLLEVNARFWGSLPLPVALGVDMPYYLFELLLLGKEPVQVDYPVGRQARNIAINAYDVLCRDTRKGSFSWKRLWFGLSGLLMHPINLLRGKELSDTFQRDDLAPAFAEIFGVPIMFLLGRFKSGFGRDKSSGRKCKDQAQT